MPKFVPKYKLRTLMFKDIKIEGNHNIVLTDIHGSIITLSVSDLLEKHTAQLAEVLQLLKGQEEAAYIKLAQQIKEYQNKALRSDLDNFNLYLEQAENTQDATTSQPIIGKTVADLDARQLKKLFAQPRVKEHFRKYKIPQTASIEEKLRALRLMTNGYVVKGTFLCLANFMNFGFISGFVDEVSFGAFDTLDKIIIKKSEHPLGNVIQQYQTLFEYITNELSPQIMIDISNREWDYSIPKIVIQELLANALVHRSYNADVRRRVSVDMYPDRIVIENPGSFPADIDPLDLSTLKSEPKNKEIARIFFLHKLIEDKGSGIARVQNLLKQRNMRPAEFKQENGFVIVTVYKREAINDLFKEAQIANQQGNYEHALATYLRMINIQEKAEGSESPDLANAYMNIASVYQNMGDYEKSLDYELKSLVLYEKNLAPDHQVLGICYNNIATTYLYLSNWEKALSYQQKALSIFLKALPSGHQHIKNGINMMINILREATKEKGDKWAAPYTKWFLENCKDYLQE